MLMALGSSWFGLFFLGSGSTFGSTSPPLSGGAILPLYPSSFLWAANPTGISWSRRDTRLAKRRNHRGPQLRIAGCCLPGVLRQTNTEILAQELRRAKNPTTSPLSLLGVRRRSLNFEGGGRHSRNFQLRGSRAGRPERRSPTALAGRWFPSGWEGKHSRNFRRSCSPEQLSDFLLQ
jgi:hypothetical protein